MIACLAPTASATAAEVTDRFPVLEAGASTRTGACASAFAPLNAIWYNPHESFPAVPAFMSAVNNNGKPTYHIVTFGCQMNVSDSERMEELLRQQGYECAPSMEDADLVLINTCSVREKPERKVESLLGQLKQLKQRRPHMVVGLCGCMAQRTGTAALASFPAVDLLVGTASIERLPELIQQVRDSRTRAVALDIPRTRAEALSMPRSGPRVPVTGKLKSFVPIIDGCDKACAFCIVPYTRGRERSRPPDEIVAEVQRLVDAGCKEVTLIGQNVNAYMVAEEGSRRSAGHHFARLLERLNDIPGLLRIRFTTNHPLDFRQEMIDAVANLPKVCEWIHLPVQAGDNNLLRRMRRGYTREHYLDLVARIREHIPDCVITTDLMVGFPGETEEEFRNTLSLVEQVRFDAAYTFAYSPRPNTPAAKMEDQVPRHVKQRRLKELIDLQNAISTEKNAARLGRPLEVLVEGFAKERGQLTGHSRGNQTVNFPGDPSLIGRLVTVIPKEAYIWGFVGEVLQPAPVPA
ncbi:MAG: tRNA (N6-isopentenyl adenosine(37)-C2)-methylthiotransferase MiaB [Armatimonadota bacterium]